jgi:hypothetical protein
MCACMHTSWTATVRACIKMAYCSQGSATLGTVDGGLEHGVNVGSR